MKPSTSDTGRAKWSARKRWTMVLVCIATFMLLLDVTVVSVAMPAIGKEFHTTWSSLQWVLDAYTLVLAILLLPAGRLADIFGRRLVLGIGTGVFTAASAACTFAPSVLILDAARAVQGAAGAAMFATSLAMLTLEFTGEDRPRALGIWGAVLAGAVAVGPLIGGALVSALGWRAIFAINIPIGALSVPLMFRFLAESREERRVRIDWAGVALVSVGLATLVYALLRGDQEGWGSPPIIVMLAVAPLALIAFWLTESRVTDPLLDLRLLRQPAFAGSSAAAFAVSGAIVSALVYLTLYLEVVHNFAAILVGLGLVPLTGVAFVCSPLAARLSKRIQPRWLLTAAMVLTAAGMAALGLATEHSPWAVLLPGLVLVGAGYGASGPVLTGAAMGTVPPEQAGAAAGTLNAIRQIGIATGIAAFGTLFQSALTDSLASHFSPSLTKSLAGQPISGLTLLQHARAGRGATAVFQSAIANALDVTMFGAAGLALLGAIAAVTLVRPRPQGSARHDEQESSSRVAADTASGER
jgi:EmrB/QacA subfamily drug resistance transporter